MGSCPSHKVGHQQSQDEKQPTAAPELALLHLACPHACCICVSQGRNEQKGWAEGLIYSYTLW